MYYDARTSMELGFVLFIFFVMAPSIAAAIGYAAWKGKPKSFDREMYWTAFIATGVVAGVVILYALGIQDIGWTCRHVLQFACLGLGAIILGVSLGFGIGIFTRRGDSLTNHPE